jgi:hypothetical protein
VPLGCGLNTAAIFDRGGMNRIFPIDVTTFVDYARVKDDISNALIRIPSSAECCGQLANVEPVRNELVIFRDGPRVWEGPITRMAFTADEVEIAAKDVMFYPYRTIMRNEYNNAYPNISTVTGRLDYIFQIEMARKEGMTPPINVLPYLRVYHFEGEARTSRHSLPFQKTVWEELDDLAAKAGIDYTVVGRGIHIFDTEYQLGLTPLATEADFLAGLTVTAYGMNLTTFSAVTDGEGRYGSAQVDEMYYGNIETLATAYDEESSEAPTDEELRSQAQRNLSQRFPVPVVVRVPDNSQIDPASEAFAFENLVPGVKVPLMATVGCRQVRQDQKITNVRVQQDEKGERITLTLFPFPGQVPTDIAEGGIE